VDYSKESFNLGSVALSAPTRNSTTKRRREKTEFSSAQGRIDWESAQRPQKKKLHRGGGGGGGGKHRDNEIQLKKRQGARERIKKKEQLHNRGEQKSPQKKREKYLEPINSHREEKVERRRGSKGPLIASHNFKKSVKKESARQNEFLQSLEEWETRDRRQTTHNMTMHEDKYFEVRTTGGPNQLS